MENSNSLASSIRSDSLATLRPLVEQNPLFKSFEGLFQITIIIDANIILRDLLWLVRKRDMPGARSELKELLDSGTVVAVAPTFLKEEICLNIQKLSNERAIPIEDLTLEWEEYSGLITFIEVGKADAAFQDPKDAPYIKLQRQSGHLIYSRDYDIRRMGGQVVPPAVFATLRLYSRHVAVEYTLLAGGQGTLLLSFAMVSGIIKLSRAILPQIKKISRTVLWTAFFLIVCGLLHGPTRQFIKSILPNLQNRARRLGGRLIDEFASLTDEHQKAKKTAEAALAAAKETLAMSNLEQ